MDSKEFSDKLMELSTTIQSASKEKQKAFALLFSRAKDATDAGFTQEEIQMIALTAHQIATNPNLKQLWSILMGSFDIDPKDDFQ